MMVSIHDNAGMDELRTQHRLEPNDLRRLRNSFYKKHQSVGESLEKISQPQRPEVASQIAFHCLELHSKHDSKVDGASKLLFRTASGQLLESVILRTQSGRTSLCVSSQIGCAARCAFCATGQMGMAVSLSRDEILDQVIQANQLLKKEDRSIRNVVFMGMGEPFHNETAVHAAIEVLLSTRCFDLSPRLHDSSTVANAPRLRLFDCKVFLRRRRSQAS